MNPDRLYEIEDLDLNEIYLMPKLAHRALSLVQKTLEYQLGENFAGRGTWQNMGAGPKRVSSQVSSGD
jgi:hypothetical protein